MKDNRRSFIKKTAIGTTGITLGAATAGFTAKSYSKIQGANDRINMSVIGVRGQGNGHLRRWAGMAKKDNVYVKTICDVDENLFAERALSAGAKGYINKSATGDEVINAIQQILKGKVYTSQQVA